MHTSGITPAAGLGHELQSAQDLLQLLQQEQACLVNADVEGLSKLTEEKARLASQMSELAKSRHGMLAAAGFDASESGMQTWLASGSATADDQTAWNALLALAESGKELNRVNGMLIAQHMGLNQAALNVLQGTPQGGDTYGPNGQSTTKISSRRLVVG